MKVRNPLQIERESHTCMLSAVQFDSKIWLQLKCDYCTGGRTNRYNHICYIPWLRENIHNRSWVSDNGYRHSFYVEKTINTWLISQVTIQKCYLPALPPLTPPLWVCSGPPRCAVAAPWRISWSPWRSDRRTTHACWGQCRRIVHRGRHIWGWWRKLQHALSFWPVKWNENQIFFLLKLCDKIQII